MKKLLTVLVIFVYFVPTALFLTFYTIFTQNLNDSSVFRAFAVPIILMTVVCGLVVVNIAGAIWLAFQEKCLSFRTVLVFKLCLIPFYIVNFGCWAIASMVFHIALFIWPIIPFIIAYTYFTMLGTSVHIIGKLFALRKSKMITAKQFVIHCILQIIFAADVIDSVYLAIRQKRLEPVLSDNGIV